MAVSVMAAGVLTLVGTKPVLAEFEIQESQVEKGEVELEYRGAYHWGLPRGGEGGGTGVIDDEEGGEVEEDGEEVPLRQSHDFEMQMGITDRWMFSTSFGTVVPEGGNWQAESVEIEVQYELIERKGNGLGLAFQAGYGFATQADTANEVEFGPIVELGLGNFLLTTNTFLSDQQGEFAEAEGLGFEYGWRAEYDFSKSWGIGVEMFGEIEDLANAGSFDDQEHSIGPTIFFKLGEERDEAGDYAGEARSHRGDGDDDDGDNGATKAPEMEFSMNVGLQFGLTDLTSDGAVKFQGSLAF